MTGLRNYYEEELRSLTDDVRAFARELPESMRGRLGLSAEGETDDPHVLALIQSFAYLSARTRLKIDDDFKEIVDGFLTAMAPELRTRIPSFSIVQLELNRVVAGANPAGVRVERGVPLETPPMDGTSCTYRTVYPVRLWPITVENANYGPPLPGTRIGAGGGKFESVVVIDLACFPGEPRFSTLVMDAPLRLCLWPKNRTDAFALHEALFRDVVDIVVRDPGDPRDDGVRIEPGLLGQVGFDPDEGLQDYDARTPLGSRVLTEFFLLPEKFLFVDLPIPASARTRLGKKMRIEFRLRWAEPALEGVVDQSTFRLGCTPVVNLLERTAIVDLDERRFEYPVEPDRRSVVPLEVHSIRSVVAIAGDGTRTPCLPIFKVRHSGMGADPRARYHEVRRKISDPERPSIDSRMFLQFVDPEGDRRGEPKRRLIVECTCTNGSLPADLGRRIRGGSLEFRPVALEQVSRVETLMPLTEPLPRLGGPRESEWWVINRLVANHTPIAPPAGASDADREAHLEAFRELLRLHDFKGSEDVRAMISGVARVETRSAVAIVAVDGASGHCRGVDVIVDLEVPEHFRGRTAFLFARVLEVFLSLHVSINSFTRLEVRFLGAGSENDVWRGAPRAGRRALA